MTNASPLPSQPAQGGTSPVRKADCTCRPSDGRGVDGATSVFDLAAMPKKAAPNPSHPAQHSAPSAHEPPLSSLVRALAGQAARNVFAAATINPANSQE